MDALKWYERGITFVLIIFMSLVLLLSTVDLGWSLYQSVITSPVFMLDVEELLDIFGLFMIVIIGIELLETIKAYMYDNIIHSEIVLEVAIIAIARKVIILDIRTTDTITMLGIAAIIVSLAISFYLLRKAVGRSRGGLFQKKAPQETFTSGGFPISDLD